MRILLFNPIKKYKVIHLFVDEKRPPRERTAKREPRGVSGQSEKKHYKKERKGWIIVKVPFCLFSYEHQSNQRS
jgi:hypothetical protein